MSDAPKVLIADDEQACIDFVEEALADTDCVVLAAHDGAEALAVARDQQPSVVILDVQMPKLSGFDVFAQLRQDPQLATVPVIMLTAVSERTGVDMGGDDMGQYYGSKPEAFLDKPIEPIVLQQTVRRLLKTTTT